MKQLSIKLFSISFIYLAASISSFCQTSTTDKRIVVVTLDGFRWQEVFRGADEIIMRDRKYFPQQDSVTLYQDENQQRKRKILLPFLWNTIATQGQLYGNRDLGSFMNCSNPYWFSYPGYHELFVGAVDRKVCSNVKIVNPNPTVFEFVNEHPDFKNEVAAFSTWDAFPYILRESASGIPVNAGLDAVADKTLNENEVALNRRLNQTKNRTDSITFQMGFEYLKKHRPRVMYFAFDETDHYAHGARYDLYLNAAHRADQWSNKIWTWIQSDPEYKGKTTLLITTDHGRGHTLRKSWRHHGRFTFGSGQVWMAAIGPEIPSFGEMVDGPQIFQKQIASTIASLLGVEYSNSLTAAPAIKSVIRPMILMAEVK